MITVDAWQVCTVMYCGGERGACLSSSPHPSMVRDRAACPNAQLCTPVQVASSNLVAQIGFTLKILKFHLYM